VAGDLALKGALRRRYSLSVSVIYIGLGVVIAVRSLVSHVGAIALLGVVFIALGTVRVREYLKWRRSADDS
jgi:uncharacterized membrane protein HdeD (DUF308 family)